MYTLVDTESEGDSEVNDYSDVAYGVDERIITVDRYCGIANADCLSTLEMNQNGSDQKTRAIIMTGTKGTQSS